MKKATIIALFIILASAVHAHAMTLGDVLQQYDIYKKEQVKSPAVLGASTQTGIPGTAAVVPKSGVPVLLKALTYTEGSSAIITRQLTKGMQAQDDVRKLQLFLIAKGYLTADPTGNYFSQTAEALRKFQAEKGIAGDGTVVGPATRAAITADVAAIASQFNH